MKKITQKEVAKFYGVAENTIVNWAKPQIQTDPETGETVKFHPYDGRHNLVDAAKLYYRLSQEGKDGISNRDYILDALTELESAESFLNTPGEIQVDGKQIPYTDIGKQKLAHALGVLSELKLYL